MPPPGHYKEMATPSSIHAWKIPPMEESGSYIPWDRKESDATEKLTLCVSNRQVMKLMSPLGLVPSGVMLKLVIGN